MEISVELTLSPLQDDFKAPIEQLIKKLRKSGFKVLENPLSTQVYGKYTPLMEFLSAEIENTFSTLDHVVLHMKIVKGNLSDYAAGF